MEIGLLKMGLTKGREQSILVSEQSITGQRKKTKSRQTKGLEGVERTMFIAEAWAKKGNGKIQSQNFPRDRQKGLFLARLTPKIEKIPVRGL